MRLFIDWKDYRQFNQQQLPDAVRPWLLDRGSLTERLINASGGDFEVKLLRQRWGTPTHNEAQILGMKPREHGMIREVLLICNGEPWVYARSILPHRSLTGSLRFLRKLKNSALGALLFKDPHLVRSQFQVATLSLPNSILDGAEGKPVYGRRSLFFLHNQPLLVAEIFLPQCQLSNIHNPTHQLSLHGQSGI